MNDWWIGLWGSQLTNRLLMGCVYQRYLKYIQEGKHFITPSPLLFCLFYCRPSSWLFPSNHPLLSKVFLKYDTWWSLSIPYQSPEPESHQLASYFPHDIKWTANLLPTSTLSTLVYIKDIFPILSTQFLSKIPSHDEKTSQGLYTGLEVYECLMINPLTKLLPKSLNSKPSRHVTALHSLLSLQLREFICTVSCSLFQLIVQLYLENKGNVLETITDF